MGPYPTLWRRCGTDIGLCRNVFDPERHADRSLIGLTRGLSPAVFMNITERTAGRTIATKLAVNIPPSLLNPPPRLIPHPSVCLPQRPNRDRTSRFPI